MLQRVLFVLEAFLTFPLPVKRESFVVAVVVDMHKNMINNSRLRE